MEKIITKVPTKIIQEKIVDKTIYKSFDGKEFDKESDCLKHEERLTNIVEFKKRFKFREIDEEYTQVLKYKFQDYMYDTIYAIVIYVPFEKDLFFLMYFKEVFGYDFKAHKIEDEYEGTMILLEIFEDGGGNSYDRYFYNNITRLEVLLMLDELKDYFQKI